MKTVLTLFILAAFGLFVKAADVPEAAGYYPDIQTLSLTGVGQTNIVAGTNDISGNLYHTWYLTSTNLNGNSCTIAFSGDKTNFVTWAVLSVANNGAAFTNVVAKHYWVKYTFTGTNALGSLVYVGGR